MAKKRKGIGINITRAGAMKAIRARA